MIITHKNTGSIGDISITWPALSGLSKKYGPLDISFPDTYSPKYYNGLKEFLEYQDFINKVDFEDKIGDLDIQVPLGGIENLPSPPQLHRCHIDIKKALNIDFDIDYDLKLKVPYCEIPENIKNKYIIIDRVKTSVIKSHNIFQNEDKFYWIKPTIHDVTLGDTFIYNINVCIQTRKKILATATGLPLILEYFDKEMIIIGLDYSSYIAWDLQYMTTKSHLKFAHPYSIFDDIAKEFNSIPPLKNSYIHDIKFKERVDEYNKLLVI